MLKTPETELKLAKTNYIVCCWSGNRRTKDLRYIQDRSYYIKHHMMSLLQLNHNLSQITLAISHNPSEPQYYSDYITSLPTRIRDAKVVVWRRNNIGMTYGALSEYFSNNPKEFQYYFIIEDDYIFCKNHFDTIFVKEIMKRPKCGFLAGLSGDLYADMHIGCIKNECLALASSHNNGTLWPIPWYIANNRDYYEMVYENGQVNFGRLIKEVGYTVEDYREKYSVCFRDDYPSAVRWFYKNASTSPIIIPI